VCVGVNANIWLYKLKGNREDRLFSQLFFSLKICIFLFSILSGLLTFYNSERHIYPFELYDEKACVLVCV